jgi:adenylate cyclase
MSLQLTAVSARRLFCFREGDPVTPQGVKRKLTAILSADVVGYSRLMGDDDAATVRTLGEYREVMANYIIQYRGRVVDSPGDNLLAEFASVVDAVQCAVEIQRELAERNSEIPEDRKMQYRIGVNLGDVIEEGKRIYGDGVNVAARLESLAEPGGICISSIAHSQVKNKLSLEYKFIGKKSVKNIKEPIGVYRVLSFPGAAAYRVTKAKRVMGRKWRSIIVAIVVVLGVGLALAIWNFYLRSPSIEPASVERMALPLPDKPSIAVLPFVNMSDDPKQEYFSDGLTDQIISGLSKIPYLFVIARNSTFTYKGKPVKVQKVAEDLGVKYVLEGSVQKTTDRIRVTAQLIDALTGRHLWAETYDRKLEDIFAIQDDITMEIMKAMGVELRGEQARILQQHGTTNLKAYEKFLEGMSYYRKFTREDNARARELFEEAIALDSQFAPAYVYLGWTYFFDGRFGWSESRVKSNEMAFKYAQKVLEIDDTMAFGYTLLSAVHLVRGQYEKAVAAAEHALTLSPNGALAYNTMAGVVGCSGRWEDSIGYAKKSIRLDPFPPVHSYHWLGRAYFMTGICLPTLFLPPVIVH